MLKTAQRHRKGCGSRCSGARGLAPLLLEISNSPQHFLVDVAVGGQHAASAGTVCGTVQAADAPTGLLDQQRSSRDIPRMELLLPEALEPAGGDVAEIERRGTQPAPLSNA